MERGSKPQERGLSLDAEENQVVTIETSRDLTHWSELLVGHGSMEGVADLRESDPVAGHGYYRAVLRPRGATDDRKNVIRDTGDRFLSPAGEPWRVESRWVKFAVLLDAPHRVWFQDSSKHAFHYGFAVARLPGFAGLTRAEFDAVTLRTNRQKAVLGAVVFPPTPNIREIGIQIVGLDSFPRERVAEWFETVRAMIQHASGTKVMYLPTYEQSEVARANRGWFEGRGITVSDAGRWVVGDECYAPGWALGRMVFFRGAEIAKAYGEGRLRPDDILLTDQVPAEVPPVAGILSMQPATPNSHVALLSRSFGIPFAYLADAAERARASEWPGLDVMIRAIPQFGGCDLTVERVEGSIDPTIREAIAKIKDPPVLNLPAMAASGAIAVPTENLRPSDITKVGGKAANFGILRRRIPDHSPSPAIALTFDLWKGYLDQALPGGGTLREAVLGRLKSFHWPPDMAALQSGLAQVRAWITGTADFSSSQRAEVLAALQEAGFTPDRPIRFRSSTNVEDSDQFSGAGLYDSYSGCLADDLDADTDGPSRCDPGEARERGVFRALRRVYASFYNDNAYLERLRHRIDETTVGMAVLVHPSTPDEFELANGVATLEVTKGDGRYVSGTLVTQLGAVSVTNPDNTAVPEEITLFHSGGVPLLNFGRASSLVPLGGKVMVWETDYRSLFGLLNSAALGYEAEFPSRKTFSLDFEFKKRSPDGRFVKQIREVPRPAERTFQPWLVGTAPRYEVFQGEHGDIVAYHRLKSEWTFRTRTTGLLDAHLGRTLFTDISGRWLDGTNLVAIGGMPEGWAGYAFRRGAEFLTDGWLQDAGAAGTEQREFRTYRSGPTTSREGPLVTLDDLRLLLVVRYPSDRPTLGYLPDQGNFGPTTTREETVWLRAVTPVTAESLRQERELKVGGVTVRTSFWWPAPPKGASAGYTAHAQAWIETRIRGLVSEEIVLRSAWAQTYHPGHHNFFEEFLFEPGRDPDVPTDVIRQLGEQGIRAIVLGGPNGDFGDTYGYVWGTDGRFRKM